MSRGANCFYHFLLMSMKMGSMGTGQIGQFYDGYPLGDGMMGAGQVSRLCLEFHIILLKLIFL